MPDIAIVVMVRGDKAIVRKTAFYRCRGGTAVDRHSLATDGRWVQVREGESCPDECILSVVRYGEDEVVDGGLPAGFMDGTAASMLDFVLMGGDLCEALGVDVSDLEEEDD